MNNFPEIIDLPTKDEKNLACLAHLSGLLGSIIPMSNIIVPLVLWLIKKEESEHIGKHSLESLNFQITFTILVILTIPLFLIVIGFFLFIAICISALIFTIIAAVKAYEGKEYKYPVNFRFIK